MFNIPCVSFFGMINIGKYKIHTHIATDATHTPQAPLFCTVWEEKKLVHLWLDTGHLIYITDIHRDICIRSYIFSYIFCQVAIFRDGERWRHHRELSSSPSFDECFTNNFTWSSMAYKYKRWERNKSLSKKEFQIFIAKVGASFIYTYAKCAQKGLTSIKNEEERKKKYK